MKQLILRDIIDKRKGRGPGFPVQSGRRGFDTHSICLQPMSGYTVFAVDGAGKIGSYQGQGCWNHQGGRRPFPPSKVSKTIHLMSRLFINHYDNWLWTTKDSKHTIQADAKEIQVDYSNDAFIKHALIGVDVVISTVPTAAFDVQSKIAAAAKEVDVKLFVPSEFGGISERASEGIQVVKANVQAQLKAWDSHTPPSTSARSQIRFGFRTSRDIYFFSLFILSC